MTTKRFSAWVLAAFLSGWVFLNPVAAAPDLAIIDVRYVAPAGQGFGGSFTLSPGDSVTVEVTIENQGDPIPRSTKDGNGGDHPCNFTVWADVQPTAKNGWPALTAQPNPFSYLDPTFVTPATRRLDSTAFPASGFQTGDQETFTFTIAIPLRRNNQQFPNGFYPIRFSVGRAAPNGMGHTGFLANSPGFTDQHDTSLNENFYHNNVTSAFWVVIAAAADPTVQIVGAPATANVGEVFGSIPVNYTNAGSRDLDPGTLLPITFQILRPNGSVFFEDTFPFVPNEQQRRVGGSATVNFGPWVMPYSESGNSGQWRYRATIDTSNVGNPPGLVNNFSNVATSPFTLGLPNLVLDNLTMPPILQPGRPPPPANAYGVVTLTNNGAAWTDVSMPISVAAWIGGPSPDGMGGLANIDYEVLQVYTPAYGFPFGLPPGGSIGLDFSELSLPMNAVNGQYTLNAHADHPQPGLIDESGEGDNEAQVTQQMNLQPDLFISHFSYDRGNFRGGDPVKINVAITNAGPYQVRANQSYHLTVALSTDGRPGGGDFFLREVELTGNNAGRSLIAGETVALEWVQAMPGNFVGTFYPYASIDSQNILPENDELNNVTDFTESPLITLYPADSPETDIFHEGTGIANAAVTALSETPDLSNDGQHMVFVSYEQLDALDTNTVADLYVRDNIDNTITLITTNFDGGATNGHSIYPSISGDGRYVAFSSEASNLVPGDTNNVSDVFFYDRLTHNMQRITQSATGGQTTGGSFLADINYDGTLIVYESTARNVLGTDSSGQYVDTNRHADVFLYSVPLGKTYLVSLNSSSEPADGGSHAPAITTIYDESRNPVETRVAFSSDAANLDILRPDTNLSSDVFVARFDHMLNHLNTLRVNLTPSLEEASHSYLSKPNPPHQLAESAEADISLDGKYVTFFSKAENMVSSGGITQIRVETPGFGYSMNPIVSISDTNGIGTGAKAVAVLSASQLGSVRIIIPGLNYQKPIATITHHPDDPNRSVADGGNGLIIPATVTALLTNPHGEVYVADVDEILTNAADANTIVRVSQNEFGVGGLRFSREPAINVDGRYIAYRTQAHNLLPSTFTRSDGEVFANSESSPAAASFTVGGAITHIDIINSGSGYSNGFVNIVDLSGRGTGVIATLELNPSGAVIGINIQQGGANYDPLQTIVRIPSSNTGRGFIAGQVDTTGQILDVQITYGGRGYVDKPNIFASGSGNEAVVDPDLIQIGPDGEVLLFNKFSLKFEDSTGTSINPADGDSVTLDDGVNPPITYEFDDDSTIVSSSISCAIGANSIITLNTLLGLIDASIASGNLTFENVTVSFDEILLQVSGGTIGVSDPDNMAVVQQSHMYSMGSGYDISTLYDFDGNLVDSVTHATPTISPRPHIIGFSELAERAFDDQTDEELIVDEDSSDVYLLDRDTDEDGIFDEEGATMQIRVSKNRFGYPVGESISPSSRNPTLSAHARYIGFSSDADGIDDLPGTVSASLALGRVNTAGLDQNGVRDVFIHNRKTPGLILDPVKGIPDHSVHVLYPMPGASYSFAVGRPVPVLVRTRIEVGSISEVELFVNDDSMGPPLTTPSLPGSNHWLFDTHWRPTTAGTYHIKALARNHLNEPSAFSSIAIVTVPHFEGSFPPNNVAIRSPSNGDMFTSVSKVRLSSRATDPDGGLEASRFVINGASAMLQLRALPNADDNVTITLQDGELDSNVTMSLQFVTMASSNLAEREVTIGQTIEETVDNLVATLKTQFPLSKMVVSKYDTHTVHFEFFDHTPTTGGLVTSSSPEVILAQTFSSIPRQVSENPNQFPFEMEWSPGLPGIYTITAVTHDNSGNYVASAPVTVTATVGDLTGVPVISLYPLDPNKWDVNTSSYKYPVNEAIFIQVQTAYDPDGGILQAARFYVNGQVDSTDPAAPYFYLWTPPGVGHYEIHARIRDDEGNFGISQVFAVDVVNEGAPTLQFTNPSRILTGTGSNFTTPTRLLTGTGTVGTRTAARRAGTHRIRRGGITLFTVTGTGTVFKTEVVRGQKVKFVSLDGTKESSEYRVSSVTDDETLVLEGTSVTGLNPNDAWVSTEATSIQVIDTWRAGSWFRVTVDALEQESAVQSVQFYVNGKANGQPDQNWPFTTKFVPPAKGTYVLRAVATDTNNIESITERVIEVSERIGEIPSGMFSIYPDDYSYVARGSKLMAVPEFLDSDGSIARVEFYLNGKLIHIDDAEPFYCIFSPESKDDISTINRRWELTMVGIDNNDNRISLPASGVVAGAVIMPNFQITQPLNGAIAVDGEEIDVIVEATDSNNAHLGFNPNPIATTSGQLELFANGQLIGTVNELGTGSGHFSYKWAVNEALATFNQKVDIVAVSTMNPINMGGAGGPIIPTLVSDPVTIKVETRDPINDPQAAVVQTYNDILLYNPTEEEVEASLEEILDGTLTHSQWTSNLTQRGAFQDIVDAVASYYITVGDWPSFLEVRDALLTYSLKPDNKTPDVDLDGYSASQENKYGTMDDDPASFPSHEFRVLDYIDDLFRSSQFVRKHGALKKMQGTSATEDLELNRRDFVSLLIKNMTNGMEATVQQRIQGSYRMQGFDPNSSASQQQQLQQQMMQMAMMGGGFGFGGMGGGGGRGNNNNNNNQMNFFNQLFNNNNNSNNNSNSQYKSGISPVVFTGYLVTEDKIENLDLVWGVPSMRNAFHTAALMLALWQDKQDQIEMTEVSQLSSLDDAARIEKMLDDYRYRTRFAYVWNEAETPNSEVPDWKYLDWFGYFNYRNHPWTYHQEHGWIYMGSSSDENMWFYDSAIGGWLWTSKTVYPYVHDATRDSWLYYEKGTSPRQFYDFHKGAWENR